jgi:hypothetical protein
MRELNSDCSVYNPVVGFCERGDEYGKLHYRKFHGQLNFTLCSISCIMTMEMTIPFLNYLQSLVYI